MTCCWYGLVIIVIRPKIRLSAQAQVESSFIDGERQAKYVEVKKARTLQDETHFFFLLRVSGNQNHCLQPYSPVTSLLKMIMKLPLKSAQKGVRKQSTIILNE